MLPPRSQLTQAIWFLSRPWPHLGGLRELVARTAFRVKWEVDGVAKEKIIEGCAAVPLDEFIDEAQLIQSLDAAETCALLLPEAQVIAWRDALESADIAEIPERLFSYAAADAGLRALGVPMVEGFPLVWQEESRRRPGEPFAEWMTLESDPHVLDRVIPGLSLQQEIALAQALGESKLSLRGPWHAPITHIPQREAAMMADFHGDLYAPALEGPSVGGPEAVLVHCASVAKAWGFGYKQTIETHRRMGVGRLRGN